MIVIDKSCQSQCKSYAIYSYKSAMYMFVTLSFDSTLCFSCCDALVITASAIPSSMLSFFLFPAPCHRNTSRGFELGEQFEE